jgi:hypothetical protein
MHRTTTTTVAATAELAIPTLVNTIKAHLAKAAQAADKAEQHYITAGLRLKELKLRKPSATPWPEYVRETFGLGQQRADELIRIADGRTTVAAVHASQKTRDAKRRPSKSNVGHIESPRLKTGEFRRLDGRVQVDDSDKLSPEVKAAADDAKLTSKQRLAISRLPDEAEQLKTVAKMAAINIVADRTEKTAAAKSAKPMSNVARAADRAEPLAPDPIQEPCTDCDTPEQFWERSLGNLAGDAISMRAFWNREFGEWEKFEVPSSLVTLAKQAAKVWTELAADLEHAEAHLAPERVRTV